MNDQRPSRQTPHAPERSAVYERAFFSALIATAIAIIVLKLLLGLAFVAALVVGIVAFVLFFGMTLRTTHRDDR